MIVSHQKRFVFVHVNKAAGTSIKRALRPHADVTYRKYTLRRLMYVLGLAGPVGEHSTALEIRSMIGASCFDSYFSFAFVRNPWDWQVSQYHYILSRPFHPQHRLVKRLSGFSDYLAWHIEHDKMCQKDFVTDESGNLMVSYLGRFETLADDFGTICKHVGISCPLPHSNNSAHQDYRHYYNDEAAELVAHHFRDDIDYFGYSFDDPTSTGNSPQDCSTIATI